MPEALLRGLNDSASGAIAAVLEGGQVACPRRLPEGHCVGLDEQRRQVIDGVAAACLDGPAAFLERDQRTGEGPLGDRDVGPMLPELGRGVERIGLGVQQRDDRSRRATVTACAKRTVLLTCWDEVSLTTRLARFGG